MDLIDLVVEQDLSGLRAAIDDGCPVDAANRQGFTALHVAAQEHAIEVMDQLLQAGADVDARNFYGNTPLWVAVFNSRGRGEAIELLLRNGADPDAINHAGRSPRQLGEAIGNRDVTRVFDAL